MMIAATRAVRCPSSARRVMGKDYEPKALCKELMKDLMFYEESGGA